MVHLTYTERGEDLRVTGLSLNPSIRHTRESGYPIFSVAYWIPAGAGMTESESPDVISLRKAEKRDIRRYQKIFPCYP